MTNASLPNEIWHTRCPVPTPLGIAINLGWIDRDFARLGVTVKSLQDIADETLRNSHIDHGLQHSFRQGGSVPAIWARSAGADTRVIGLTWTDESQAVLALPGSGINSVQDLRGRKIGLSRRRDQKVDIFRATALRALLTALEVEGVGEHEVEWVDIDVAPTTSRAQAGGGIGWRTASLYADELGALVRGEVDAIHVKGSLGHETAFIAGANVIADTGFHPDPKVRINNGAPRPLTVDAATLDQYPELATRLLGRVIQAGEWAAEHPAETLAYLASETGSAPQWVKAAYGGDRLHHNLRTDLSDESIAALGDYADFLFQRGFIPNPVDAHAWVDRRAFDALAQQPLAAVA